MEGRASAELDGTLGEATGVEVEALGEATGVEVGTLGEAMRVDALEV